MATTATAAAAPSGQVFEYLEKGVNIVAGAKLFTEVVTEEEEREHVDWVLARCAEGRAGKLSKPTFLQAGGARSRGNKRQSLQYGGFFDFNKACPGKRGLVPPFPPWLAKLTQRLVERGYLPRHCVPNTCIINYYTPGDCIPPHVDHESYPRPICTISLMGQEDMLLGTKYVSCLQTRPSSLNSARTHDAEPHTPATISQPGDAHTHRASVYVTPSTLLLLQTVHVTRARHYYLSTVCVVRVACSSFARPPTTTTGTRPSGRTSSPFAAAWPCRCRGGRCC